MKKKKLKAEIKYLQALLLESREQCLRLEDEFLLRLQTEQSILDQIARVEADNEKYSQIEIKGRVLALVQFIKQTIKQEDISDLLAKEQVKRILPIQPIPGRLLEVPDNVERIITVTCSGSNPQQAIVSGIDQDDLPIVEKIIYTEHEFQVGDLVRRDFVAEMNRLFPEIEYSQGETDPGIYKIEKIDPKNGQLLCRIQGETFPYSFFFGWIAKENAYPYFPTITSSSLTTAEDN